jgi:hypothetical protein
LNETCLYDTAISGPPIPFLKNIYNSGALLSHPTLTHHHSTSSFYFFRADFSGKQEKQTKLVRFAKKHHNRLKNRALAFFLL